MEGIDTSRLQDMPSELLVLLVDPTSNIGPALALYGVIVLLVVIMLVAAILVITGFADDESDEASTVDEVARSAPEWADEPVAPPSSDERRRKRLVTTLILSVIALALWLATGYATASSELCDSCHDAGLHSVADPKANPHRATRCVACHESGGLTGQYFSRVPYRMLHVVDGLVETTLSKEYGRIATSSCTACHASDIAATTLNAQSGVKMSHREPMAASAECLDCHRPQEGTVSGATVGMRPCLRCHDAKTASAECGTCHDKKAAAAARARSADFASALVKDVKCGGCHDEKQSCDPCHGARMPHTGQFMAYAHARAGAVDFWYNGGRTCAKCHTATRRPCTKCHTTLLGRGHLPSMGPGHRSAPATGSNCTGCHQAFAFQPSRDFCADLCHTEAAKKESPR